MCLLMYVYGMSNNIMKFEVERAFKHMTLNILTDDWFLHETVRIRWSAGETR